MKMIFSVLILTAGLSVSAQAAEQQLVAMTCTGANGVEISLRSNSNLIRTKLGLMTRDFGTNRMVTTHNKRSVGITRIVLGMKETPYIALYDIYLSRVPVRGEKVTLKGVIGQTVNTVIFPKVGTAVTVPVGFVPSTYLNCTLLTR